MFDVLVSFMPEKDRGKVNDHIIVLHCSYVMLLKIMCLQMEKLS